MDDLNLEIIDFGQINQANIELKKINLVGGVNGSGKSTASKLLYCFLKAMASTRKEYLLEYILPKINSIINRMASPMNDDNYSKYNYTLEDDLDKLLLDYDRAKKIFNSISFPEEGLGETIQEIDQFLSIIISEDDYSYSPVVKTLFETESLLDFKGNAKFYNDSFKCSVNYTYSQETDYYYRLSELNENNIQFDDFDESFIYLTEGSFECIPDIFYIDSVSIFDLDYYVNTRDSIKRIFNYKGHLIHLLNQLKDNESKSNLSKDFITCCNNVNEKISKIIGGESSYSTLFKIGKISEDTYYFKQGENNFRVNISSGIEQISIIQILLKNNKLHPGTFLIIDEPEVNLHPEWQIKFAQILVLLVKELDINLYLNSHSPMFIEAISLYSQYYDLIKQTNIYLTQKQENNKYYFRKIDSKDMGEVYENLTSPYDELDKLKAKILFKE